MRQRRLCALTQYTEALNGRARSSPITPATHLSHSFRDALPNDTCFILLRFGSGNKNYLSPSPLSLSLLFYLSLSLPRLFPCSLWAALVCLALLKTSPRAALPHRRPRLLSARHHRRLSARRYLHLWIKFLGRDVGGLNVWSQVDIKQVIFTAFRSSRGEFNREKWLDLIRMCMALIWSAPARIFFFWGEIRCIWGH